MNCVVRLIRRYSSDAKMPKRRQSNRAAVKAAKKEKQALKAQKKQRCDETEDIKNLVETYIEKAKTTTTPLPGKLVPCDQPSPRASSSFTPIPGSSDEFLIFGGEFYEGSAVVIYNDTYRFNIKKKEWRVLDSPTIAPPPRCSHQCVATRDAIYLFGGEFATIHQFYHFRDLWRYVPKINVWTEVTTTGMAPSARSGHRMVNVKNHIVLFGGFHDTVRETRYFNDMYVLNLTSLVWRKIVVPGTVSVPCPRSGVLLGASEQTLIMAGGYRKTKDSERCAKGGALRDAWSLDINRVLHAATSTGGKFNIDSPSPWTRLGGKANLPTNRAGVSCIVYKHSLLCFGGVQDEESEAGMSLRSMYYNDIWCFDMERKRWYQLHLKKHTVKSRRSKNKAKDATSALDDSESYEGDSGDDDDARPSKATDILYFDDDDEYDTFAYIDENGKFVRIKIEPDFADDPKDVPDISLSSDRADSTSGNESDMQDVATTVSPVTVTVKKPEELRNLIEDSQTPLPRLNALLGLSGNNLIVYGGLVELGKQEFTLDDCWSLNLTTREKWNIILPGHLDSHPWNEEPDDEEDTGSTSDPSEASSDSNDSNESDDSNSSCDDSGSSLDEELKKFKTVGDKVKFLRSRLNKEVNPEYGESLKDFFGRTKTYWINDQEMPAMKDGRRMAFAACEAHYNAVRPILSRMHKLQTRCQQTEHLRGKMI